MILLIKQGFFVAKIHGLRHQAEYVYVTGPFLISLLNIIFMYPSVRSPTLAH